MMIDSPDIKAIYCVRGGYGTVQIIDYIDFSNIFKNPKWIIGFSDVTVLHSHLNNLGVSTLHSTMPINFEENVNFKGVGGGLNKDDFKLKLDKGADLVQIYTGFVIKGPKLIQEILSD